MDYPFPLILDHVTFAAKDLQTLDDCFADVGLQPQYGGAHSNGLTHMSLIGFEDGTYLELIALFTPDTEASWWNTAIQNNAGPCAWCVQTDGTGLQNEIQRLRGLGITASDPRPMHRQHPNETMIEWELGIIGDGEPGEIFPFMIHDFTPREWRVSPTPTLIGSPLTGVKYVVVAVRDLETTAKQLQDTYGIMASVPFEEARWNANLCVFDDAPIILASPHGEGWLKQRLDQVGEMPCAYILNTNSMDAAQKEFELPLSSQWRHLDIRWFAPEQLNGFWLGVNQTL